MRYGTLALLLSSLGGCIIVDKDHHDGPGPDEAWETGWYDGGSPDAYSWTFSPDVVGRGEISTLLLSSVPDFSYWDVSEVETFGGIEVCSTSPVRGGVQVVVSVAKDADDGPVDAVVVDAEGDSAWLSHALLVEGEGEGDGSTCE